MSHTHIDKIAELQAEIKHLNYSLQEQIRDKHRILQEYEATVQRLNRTVEALNKCLHVAQTRYNQLYTIHRTAKDNADVAKLVRECVTNWNDVEVSQ